ncbi:enoyl-CoA hydratase/isomerase family protein [Rhodococcus sp. NPDC003322]
MTTPACPGRIRIAIDQDVAVLTIDHPRRCNALTGQMLSELTNALACLADEPAVSVLVVTGSGPHFCAGMDIHELRSARRSGIRMEDRVTDAEETLAAFPKPTVAVVSGYCIGGGAQLALACDIRIAAEDAEFAVTPARLGVIYPPRTITRLVRTLGPATAKRLVITGDRVDSATALRVGLISEVVPGEFLRSRAAALAATIATRSSITQRAAKEMIDAAAAEGIEPELEHRWASVRNPDLHIGLDAFLTGSTPQFTRSAAAP